MHDGAQHRAHGARLRMPRVNTPFDDKADSLVWIVPRGLQKVRIDGHGKRRPHKPDTRDRGCVSSRKRHQRPHGMAQQKDVFLSVVFQFFTHPDSHGGDIGQQAAAAFGIVSRQRERTERMVEKMRHKPAPNAGGHACAVYGDDIHAFLRHALIVTQAAKRPMKNREPRCGQKKTALCRAG